MTSIMLTSLGDVPSMDTTTTAFFGDHGDFLAQKQQERQLHRLDQLTALQTTVTAYQDVIDQAVTQKTYCPQVAAYLCRWASRQHIRENTPVLSLEAINGDTLPNTYLTIKEALESFSERLSEKVRQRYRQVADGLMSRDKQQKRQEAAAYIQKRANAFQQRLAGQGERKVSLDGIGARLSVNGSVPSDMAKAVRTDLTSCRAVMDDYLTGAVEFNHRARDVLSKVTVAGPDTVGRELDRLTRMPLPTQKIPQPLTDGSGWMGDMTLRIDTIDEPDDDPYRQLANISKLKPPVLVNQQLETPDGGDVTLRKRDLTALIRALNGYGELIESANKTLSRFLKTVESDIDLADSPREGGTTKEVKGRKDHKTIKRVGELVQRYPAHITSVAPAGFNHIRQSAKAVILVLERALKA